MVTKMLYKTTDNIIDVFTPLREYYLLEFIQMCKVLTVSTIEKMIHNIDKNGPLCHPFLKIHIFVQIHKNCAKKAIF